MNQIMRSCFAATLAIALAAVLTAPAFAQEKKTTRIVCWKDKAGKVVGCGDKIPLEFQDSASREMDGRGVTRGTTESAEQAAKRRAEDKAQAQQKAEEQKRMAEQRRMDTALLNTFSNEKEIDQKRDRDLAQVDTQMGQLKVSLKNAADRHNEVKARSDAATKDKKPVPDVLKDELSKATSDVQRIQQAVAAKEKEKDDLRKLYADQKQRFRELKGEAPASATPTAERQVERAR